MQNNSDFNNEVIKACITTILNISSLNMLSLMRDLDSRILSGKTQLFDCSFQVCNAYELYVKFLPEIDPEHNQNRQYSPLNPHGLNVVTYD